MASGWGRNSCLKLEEGSFLSPFSLDMDEEDDETNTLTHRRRSPDDLSVKNVGVFPSQTPSLVNRDHRRGRRESALRSQRRNTASVDVNDVSPSRWRSPTRVSQSLNHATLDL